MNFYLLIVILQLNNRTMGLTKSEMFTDTQNAIALFAKAFAHPARVAILQQLFKMDTCYCGNLVDDIGLAQPTISQHLKELRTLGLIKGNVEGTSVCYCIDKDNWERMKAMMTHFFDQNIQTSEDCC